MVQCILTTYDRYFTRCDMTALEHINHILMQCHGLEGPRTDVSQCLYSIDVCIIDGWVPGVPTQAADCNWSMSKISSRSLKVSTPTSAGNRWISDSISDLRFRAYSYFNIMSLTQSSVCISYKVQVDKLVVSFPINDRSSYQLTWSPNQFC